MSTNFLLLLKLNSFFEKVASSSLLGLPVYITFFALTLVSGNDIQTASTYLDKNLLDILSKTNKRIKVITNKYNNDDYI